MPASVHNGITVYHNDGSEVGGSPYSILRAVNRNRRPLPVSIIVAKENGLGPDDVSLTLGQTLLDKNSELSSSEPFTGVLHLTRMEALALSHQLRKLAIGV